MHKVTKRKKWSRDCLCQALRSAADSLTNARQYAEIGAFRRNAKALEKLETEAQRLFTWAMELPVTPEEKLLKSQERKKTRSQG